MDFLQELPPLVRLVTPPTGAPRVTGRKVSAERLRLVVAHSLSFRTSVNDVYVVRTVVPTDAADEQSAVLF